MKLTAAITAICTCLHAGAVAAQCVTLAVPVQVCPQDGQAHRFDDYYVPGLTGEIVHADLVLAPPNEAVMVRFFALTQRFIDDFWDGQPRYTSAETWEGWMRETTAESGWIITSAAHLDHARSVRPNRDHNNRRHAPPRVPMRPLRSTTAW